MAERRVTVNVKPSDVPKGMSHLSQQYFFDYFSVKYLKQKHGKKLCSVRQWLTWDANRKHLEIPKDKLMQCLKSGKHFVFQTMEVSSSKGGSHAGAIIIDTKKKIATRFDSQGTAAIQFFTDYKYEPLDIKLNEFFSKLGYRYDPPELYCPYIGPQHFEEGTKISGYCASFAIYFVDMMMTYDKMSKAELVYQINLKLKELREKNKSFESYILSYVQQIYNLMWKEFPQYKDFFINYDKYSRKRNNKEFKAFELFMRNLLRNDDL